jgi:hypothetical protein
VRWRGRGIEHRPDEGAQRGLGRAPADRRYQGSPAELRGPYSPSRLDARPRTPAIRSKLAATRQHQPRQGVIRNGAEGALTSSPPPASRPGAGGSGADPSMACKRSGAQIPSAPHIFAAQGHLQASDSQRLDPVVPVGAYAGRSGRRPRGRKESPTTNRRPPHWRSSDHLLTVPVRRLAEGGRASVVAFPQLDAVR